MEKADMKYCFAIEEVLRREVVVDANTLKAGLDIVKCAYRNAQIVLDYKDIISSISGTPATIYEANWYDTQDVQAMDLTEF